MLLNQGHDNLQPSKRWIWLKLNLSLLSKMQNKKTIFRKLSLIQRLVIILRKCLNLRHSMKKKLYIIQDHKLIVNLKKKWNQSHKYKTMYNSQIQNQNLKNTWRFLKKVNRMNLWLVKLMKKTKILTNQIFHRILILLSSENMSKIYSMKNIRK